MMMRQVDREELLLDSAVIIEVSTSFGRLSTIITEIQYLQAGLGICQ